MPIHRQDIIRLCEIIAQQENLCVTVRESVKGASWAFAGALIGGIFGGPLGLGIGSAAGGALGAWKCQGKFKSVVTVIREMKPKEKDQLAQAVSNVIRRIDSSDIIMVLTFINQNNMVKIAVINVIKKYISQNLGLTVM